MGFIRRGIIGGAVGAGLGYANARPGEGASGAGVGAMSGAALGAVGGGMALAGGRALGRGAVKAGGGLKGAYGRGRSAVAQARGRHRWRGNTTQFGPVQQSVPAPPPKTRLMANKAKNSFRDSVNAVRSGIGKGRQRIRQGMGAMYDNLIRKSQGAFQMGRDARGRFLSPQIPVHGVRNAKGQFNKVSKIGKMQGRGYEGGGTLADQAMNFKPTAEQEAFFSKVGAQI